MYKLSKGKANNDTRNKMYQRFSMVCCQFKKIRRTKRDKYTILLTIIK